MHFVFSCLVAIALSIMCPLLAWSGSPSDPAKLSQKQATTVPKDEKPAVELSATERTGIQTAANHLLAARRSYPSDPDPKLEQLRTQINQARQAIEQLVQPESTALTAKSLVSPGKTAAQRKPVDERTEWRTHNASRLTHSKQKIAAIRAAMSAAMSARQGQVDADEDRYKQLPPDLNERLVVVENEVESATALPAGKREERLRELAASLKIERTPFGQRGGVTTPDIPTLGTRTGHRIPPKSSKLKTQ